MRVDHRTYFRPLAGMTGHHLKDKLKRPTPELRHDDVSPSTCVPPPESPHPSLSPGHV